MDISRRNLIKTSLAASAAAAAGITLGCKKKEAVQEPVKQAPVETNKIVSTQEMGKRCMQNVWNRLQHLCWC